MDTKILTKADIVLAIVLLVIGLSSPFFLFGKAQAKSLVISCEGETVLECSLDKDTYIIIKDNTAKLSSEYSEDADNTIEIKDGKVFVVYANCNGHDCMKMGKISKANEIIACLPHKLVLSISSKDPDAPDAVIK